MAAAARDGRSRRFGGLAARREPAGHVVGYGECPCFDICGGNTRVRAREVTGDP